MSGLYSSLGFSRESTWGTYVAPTKFQRVDSFQITRAQERPQGEGITSGVPGRYANHYVETTQTASGSFPFVVTNKNLGLLLESLCGGTSTSAVDSGSAYIQTHTAGMTFKPLTIQAGVPYRDGTVRCKTALGAKISSMEFSADANSLLTATVNFDAKKYDESQTLATPSYSTDKPFTGKMADLKLGASGSEASLAGVTAMNMTWTNAMDTENYTFGSSGLKSEQIMNGYTEVTGSITADWTSAVAAALHDRAVANTSCSLVWAFTGAQIATTYYERVIFTLPCVYFTTDTQSAGGPGVLSNTYNFTWKYDGTLPTIVVGTTETAL